MTDDIDLRYHFCPKDEREPLYDARGIYLTVVCSVCRDTKLRQYKYVESIKRRIGGRNKRPEVLTDNNYTTIEDIDPEPETINTLQWHR